MGQPPSPSFLFHHHPCRLQQRERDQADQSSCRDEQGIADLPSEQNGKGSNTDSHGQPIADRDSPEQDAGAEDGPDRGRIGALDEALNIRIAAMPREHRRRHEHEKERREENSDRRDEGAPEACHQITDEGGGDDHRAGADHADCDRDQELPLVEPPVFLHEPLSRNGTITSPLPKVSEPALRKNSRSLPIVERRSNRREKRARQGPAQRLAANGEKNCRSKECRRCPRR